MATPRSRDSWKSHVNGRRSTDPIPDIEMANGRGDDGQAPAAAAAAVHPNGSPRESIAEEVELDVMTVETEGDSTTGRSPADLGASSSTMQGRRSAILENLELQPDQNLLRELIKKCKSPLESILHFNYTLLMAPFRINKEARVVSSCCIKICAILFLGTALLQTLFGLNLTTFYINGKTGSKVKIFTEMLLIISTALNRIMFCYAMWVNRSVLSSIFETIQSPPFVQVFYNPQRWDWTLILRGSSYAWSVGICFSGMNIYRVDTLKKFGWDFKDLMDIHEEVILKSFSGLYYWAYESGHYYDQQQLFNQTVTMSSFVLGNFGIVVDTASFQLDCMIRDYFLVSVITVYLAIKSLQLALILAEDWGQWSREETRQRFRYIFEGYRRVMQLAENVNKVLKPFLPFMISEDVLHLVMIAFYILAGDWTYAISFSFNIVKTIVGIFITFQINEEVSNLEKWFISDTTQEILDFPPNKYNATLFELNRFPIGIGIAATYICEGLLVTFVNTALTYFFLIAQSLEAQEQGAAASNGTCNCTVF